MDRVAAISVMVTDFTLGDVATQHAGGKVYRSIGELETAARLTCKGGCEGKFPPSIDVMYSLRSAVANGETEFEGTTPCGGSRRQGQKRLKVACMSSWSWKGTIQYRPETGSSEQQQQPPTIEQAPVEEAEQ